MSKQNKKPNRAFSIRSVFSALAFAVGLLRSHYPRCHSPRKRVRKRVYAGLTLILLLVVVSTLTYNLVGQRFNSHIINALTRLSGGEVEVEESSINILSDIRIKKLSVYQPGMPHEDKYLIFSTSDLLLEYNPWSIFTRQLQIDRIVASEALVNLAYNHDDKTWNINRLTPVVPKGQTGGKAPDFIIRNSNIQFIESRNGVFSQPVRQEFTGRVSSDPALQVIKFNFESEDDTALPNCKVAGIFDPVAHTLEAELKFDMENFASKNLPPNLSLFRDLYDAINPHGELTLKSFYSPTSGNYVKVIFDQAFARINIPDTGIVVPLPQISGEIICTNTETTINSVQVKYDDATFNVKGKVVGYGADSEIDLEFSSPDLNLPADQWDGFDIINCDIEDAQLVSRLNAEALLDNSIRSVLRMIVLAMPKSGRTSFYEFMPTGRASVDVCFTRKESENTVSGKIDLICMGGRFIRFPYPVTNASGPITFEQGKIAFGPITGSEGDQSVIVNGGAIRLDSGKWDIETDVQVKNVAPGEKLYSALSDLQKDIYDLFKPQGRADAHYHINVVQGQEPNHYLDIQFRDCAGQFKFLPVPLEHCSGNVHWDRDKTIFTMEQGRGAGGTISLSGNVITEADGLPLLSCQVSFDKLIVDDKLLAAMPASIGKLNSQVTTTGILSGTARVSHKLKNGLAVLRSDNYAFSEMEHNINLHLTGGKMRYVELPIDIEMVDAQADFINGQLFVRSFSGVLADSGIVPGTISLTGTASQESLDFDIDCRNLKLSGSIRDYVEVRFPGIWQKYQPVGTADVKLKLNRQPDKPVAFDCAVMPVDMSAAFLGYPLTGLTGSLHITQDSLSLEKLSANNGQLEISGRLNGFQENRDYHLNIRTRSLALDDKFRATIGRNIMLFNDKTNLRGRVSSDIALKLLSDDPDNNTWQVDGLAELFDASGNFPLAATDISGGLKFALDYDTKTGTLAVNSQTNDLKAMVEGRPLEEVQAAITYDSLSGLLDVQLVDSRFCDGIMAGTISAGFKEQTSYALDIEFKDTSLAKVTLSDPAREQIDGLLGGFFRLAGDPEHARGSFQFEVSQGRLGKLALLSGILNLIKFTSTHPGVFNQATIKGDIVDGETVFSELSFKGNTIEVSGSGKMTGPMLVSSEKSGLIDLIFMIEAPDIIKPIPILGSFFNAVRSGLIYVTATGTYHQPIIEPVTLTIFTDIFKSKKP